MGGFVSIFKKNWKTHDYHPTLFTAMFTGPRQSQKDNGQSKPGSLATFSGQCHFKPYSPYYGSRSTNQAPLFPIIDSHFVWMYEKCTTSHIETYYSQGKYLTKRLKLCACISAHNAYISVNKSLGQVIFQIGRHLRGPAGLNIWSPILTECQPSSLRPFFIGLPKSDATKRELMNKEVILHWLVSQ